MSGGDVIAFSHSRGRTNYRPSELAFLDSREETSLFLHHSSGSKLGADTRDVLEDGIACCFIHLDVVYDLWKWGFVFRSARIHLVVRTRVDLRCCGFTVDRSRKVDLRE